MDSEIKFEKALERLEKIVEDLENGNMPLEDALKRYEEGVKLSRLCTQRLTQAETKIEVLTRALNGALEPEPLDEESGSKKARPLKSESQEAKKVKKAQRKSDSTEEGLLL